MSSKHRMIWLTPPVYGSKEERIESRGYTCEYCHGNGGFAGDRCSPNDSEWKVCPVCEGSGKMDAEVTIKWKPNKTKKDDTYWNIDHNYECVWLTQNFALWLCA